ncbi:MAG: hypothetical protein WAY88_02550 [Minisyncoccia bacterium]
MFQAQSFTFGEYKVDTNCSVVTFSYTVEFRFGIKKTFTDRLYLEGVQSGSWAKVSEKVLQQTLQSLSLMLGINYWSIFPTNNMHIDSFKLTREQSSFWNSLYLNGLSEFFFFEKIDFKNLINFPFDENYVAPQATHIEVSERALLLNGAGKDSVLSAEILKKNGVPFDFFAFQPTPAHKRIGNLVGAKTVAVTRKRDWVAESYADFFSISSSYPSVSTFTFTALLLAELMDYNKIVFSNERSADFGNFDYLGLHVNHQWCKSTEAEKMINEYTQKYITPDISSASLLRTYSELEIVKQFSKYPKYLNQVTSCNTYFFLPSIVQKLLPRSYWCKKCPKCVFLFASYSAFLPKKDLVNIFGADLYKKKSLLPLFRSILGIEGNKPLDCVGEPDEMILAMHLARSRNEYAGEAAMQLFEDHFPRTKNYSELEEKVFC